MILPRLRGIIRFAASRPITKALVRLVSITLRHSSVVNSTSGLRTLDAGIVDENIDRDALAIEPLERGHDRSFVGDVERRAFGLMPGVAKFARPRFRRRPDPRR